MTQRRDRSLDGRLGADGNPQERPSSADRTAQRVAILSGLAAATTGVAALPGGIRPWQIFALAALFVVIGGRGREVLAMRIGAFEVVFVAYGLSLVVVESYNSLALGYSPDPFAAIAVLLFLLLFLSAKLAVRSASELRTFLIYFSLPAIPVALIGVGQALLPQAFAFVTSLAPSAALDSRVNIGELVRASGLTGHWTGHGYYLTVCLAAVCAIVLLDRREKKAAALPVLAILILFAGVFATVTLATIAVASLVVLVFLFLLGVRPAAVVASGIGAAVLLTIFGQTFFDRLSAQSVGQVRIAGLPDWIPNTIAYRVRIWIEETMPAIADRPANGWGARVYALDDPGRTYPSGLAWPSAESQWFYTAIAYGVPVLLILSLLLILAGRQLRPAPRAVSPKIAILLSVLFVSSVVTATISPVFTNHGFPAAFWCLLGAYCGAAGIRKTRADGATTLVPKSAVS